MIMKITFRYIDHTCYGEFVHHTRKGPLGSGLLGEVHIHDAAELLSKSLLGNFFDVTANRAMVRFHQIKICSIHRFKEDASVIYRLTGDHASLNASTAAGELGEAWLELSQSDKSEAI